MFFNHPPTHLNNQIITVVSYAAMCDSLNKLANDVTLGGFTSVTALKAELKHKLHTLHASEFIRYTDALAKRLHMQDTLQANRIKFMILSGQLMEPTPAQREQLQYQFDGYYLCKEYTHTYCQIRYILRCLVDCGAVECLQKILASAPDKIKANILGDIFPKALVNMLHDADDSMLEFMLAAGMKPDCQYTMDYAFGISYTVTLLTSVEGALRTRIQEAGSKESAENGKNYFTDQEIKAYTHFLDALLTRKADPDMDEDQPDDDRTPRGYAKSALKELTENQYLSSEQKDKMGAVLRMLTDAPRVKEFKPRMHYIGDAENGITAFRLY